MKVPEATRARVLSEPSGDEAVLAVDGLSVQFFIRKGIVRAVDELSFSVARGETLGIVGESGCGKSVTALAIMRLITEPPGRIVAGTVNLLGNNLLDLDTEAMRNIRGKKISMIFQEPMTSLNPVLTVGEQISEGLRTHRGLSQKQAWDEALEAISLVHIPEPARRMNEFPHQLSGGMRQRVMIAMAVATRPHVLIADEPTTALDVTIQAQILQVMRDLQDKLGTAIILVTHDMGVIAENADNVVVMYAGRKIEEAPVKKLFATPLHPYSEGLLRSIPKLGSVAGTDTNRSRLYEIPGTVPPLHNLPTGCAFAPRCPWSGPRCEQEIPPLQEPASGHLVACWHPGGSDRSAV